MPIDADWEFERELFIWGVMPQHEKVVMDFVNKHLAQSHIEHSDIVIAVDSEFPTDEDVVWEKTNPELTNDEGLGNYIHMWVNPETGLLWITALRPDLLEYEEPVENDWGPEEEERNYPRGMTKTEWDNARNGEEG